MAKQTEKLKKRFGFSRKRMGIIKNIILRGDLMKCGNCKLWVYSLQYETVKDKKHQYSRCGKVLGACSYEGNFYPRFNYEKCPFVEIQGAAESN